MNESDAAAYGDLVADVYDDWFGTGAYDHQVAENAAEFLLTLAAGGRVLELGIGTGRVALPLARRGVEVHGIEAPRTFSPADASTRMRSECTTCASAWPNMIP